MSMSRSEAGKLGWIASQEHRNKKHKEFVDNYNKHPKVCPCCGKVIPFEKRDNTYCSQSCAAIMSNKKRKIHIDSVKVQRRSGELKTCIGCGKQYIAKRGSTGKYCSLKCLANHKYNQYIEDWKQGKVSGLVGYNISKHIRRYMLEKAHNKCQRCGWSEQNPVTGKVPLDIHHKDGNFANNKEENLEVLCPNCHSLTDTYKRLNSGGRKDRKKYS